MWLYWHVDNPSNGDNRVYYMDSGYRPIEAYAYVVRADGSTTPLTIDFLDDGISLMSDYLAVISKHNLGTIARFRSDNHIREGSLITMVVKGSGGDATGLTVGLKLEEL